MKMNNLIKVLGIALFAIVIGGGIVTAGHTGEHGEGVMTPDGWAEFKSGSIEGGDYVCWNDHDVQHHLTCIVTVDGVDYEITYKIAGKSGAKIVGVEKVVEPTPTPVPQNDTPVDPEPQNDTPVVPTNDTPVDPEPQNDTPVVPQNETPVENETDPVDPVVPQNDTPVVPVVPENNTEHASGDDVTSENGANASADIDDEVSGPAKLMKAPIKMQKAGNEWALIAIAILAIICAVGYKRY